MIKSELQKKKTQKTKKQKAKKITKPLKNQKIWSNLSLPLVPLVLQIIPFAFFY